MESHEALFKVSSDGFPDGTNRPGSFEFAECLVESVFVDGEARISVQDDFCGLEAVACNTS